MNRKRLTKSVSRACARLRDARGVEQTFDPNLGGHERAQDLANPDLGLVGGGERDTQEVGTKRAVTVSPQGQGRRRGAVHDEAHHRVFPRCQDRDGEDANVLLVQGPKDSGDGECEYSSRK